jgi:8-oxo-dGTP pyrophosphatase MutT (NUDIX family)
MPHRAFTEGHLAGSDRDRRVRARRSGTADPQHRPVDAGTASLEHGRVGHACPGPESPELTAAVPKSWKKRAAGAVIREPDGRVWLYEPTNHYGGYQQTFPKGTVDGADSFEATAAREAFEETGLLVEIGAFLIDSDRSLSVTRFFLACRIGGCPSAMGWEAQAVGLVPMADLHTHAVSEYDAPVILAAREAAAQAARADGSSS